MLFMNILKFAGFVDFFLSEMSIPWLEHVSWDGILEWHFYSRFLVRITKTREEYGFLYNPPVEGTVTIMGKRLGSFVKLMFKNSISVKSASRRECE
jgi:hypothetical protein